MVMSLNLHLAHIKIEVVESKEYAKEGKIDIGIGARTWCPWTRCATNLENHGVPPKVETVTPV